MLSMHSHHLNLEHRILCECSPEQQDKAMLTYLCLDCADSKVSCRMAERLPAGAHPILTHYAAPGSTASTRQPEPQNAQQQSGQHTSGGPSAGIYRGTSSGTNHGTTSETSGETVRGASGGRSGVAIHQATSTALIQLQAAPQSNIREPVLEGLPTFSTPARTRVRQRRRGANGQGSRLNRNARSSVTIARENVTVTIVPLVSRLMSMQRLFAKIMTLPLQFGM